jgi:hypothetical protein
MGGEVSVTDLEISASNLKGRIQKSGFKKQFVFLQTSESCCSTHGLTGFDTHPQLRAGVDTLRKLQSRSVTHQCRPQAIDEHLVAIGK